MSLGGLDTALFSLLPNEVKPPILDAPDEVSPGEFLKASVALSEGASKRVIRWELIPEGGNSPEEFMAYPWRIRDAVDGKGATVWAIGFDEKLGTSYEVIVTDVATGQSAQKKVVVKGR